jgi:hypothetical protein
MKMKKMEKDIKKVVEKIKTAQSQLQNLLNDKTWIEDARKYANEQGREVKKLVADDVVMVKDFLKREQKELSQFQKKLPGEVAKFQKFVTGQKKELGKLLNSVKRASSGKKAAGGRKSGDATGS